MPIIPPSPLQRNQRLLAVIGVFLAAIFLLVYLVPYGGRQYLALRGQLTHTQAEIAQLKNQNQELKDEVEHLRNDPSYIEKIARQKLGMLKKNEVVFEAPEKKKRQP
ncbi:MAG: septum formation initiator family protein [Desulfobacteraceae bacterium]|nr:septum formation initiator family protein [Desulfobacteraceae bacterium]